MAEVRMSLAEAAQALGIAPNSVRSRWKVGKIKGERDNANKVWVFVDEAEAANDKASKSKPSKPSIEPASKPSNAFEISQLEAHLQTLKEQLAGATTELAELRPKVMEAERLKAENDGLRGQLDIRAEQLEELRRLMAEAKESHSEELQRWMEAQPTKGFFARLLRL